MIKTYSYGQISLRVYSCLFFYCLSCKQVTPSARSAERPGFAYVTGFSIPYHPECIVLHIHNYDLMTRVALPLILGASEAISALSTLYCTGLTQKPDSHG